GDSRTLPGRGRSAREGIGPGPDRRADQGWCLGRSRAARLRPVDGAGGDVRPPRRPEGAGPDGLAHGNALAARPGRACSRGVAGGRGAGADPLRTPWRRTPPDPSPRWNVAYFFSSILTPLAPSVNFTPRDVETRCTTTPFWFCIARAPPPPPTAAPAS